MAFVTSGTSIAAFRPVKLRAESTRRCGTALRTTVRATAVQPNRTRGAGSKAAPKARPHRSAPVMDSRVSSRLEAHHWIAVKDHSRRMFERAAVAQADVAHQLEQRRGSGALHRWVLRQVMAHPSRASKATSTYLVLESFDRSVWDAPEVQHDDSLTRRWLSAVERVGPVMSTIDIRSLHYRDVFTSKLHDVVFDPNANVVVLESFNVDLARDGALDAVVEGLRADAERSVASGKCLEFCVLQSTTQPSLLKTVEIYADDTAMQEHMHGMDTKLMHNLQTHAPGTRRNRHLFKPVVFA